MWGFHSVHDEASTKLGPAGLTDLIPLKLMAHQIKHMPSLPALASALCHIATIAVVMQTRTELSTAVEGGLHRSLKSTGEPPRDPLDQMAARLEKAIDTHGARLTAVETNTADLTAILNEHTEGHEGTEHGVEGSHGGAWSTVPPRHSSYGGELTSPNMNITKEHAVPEPITAMQATKAQLDPVIAHISSMRGELGKLTDVNLQLRERVSRLENVNKQNERTAQNRAGIKVQLPAVTTGQTNATSHRRAQATPQACAQMHDFQALTAAAMDACCPVSGGGHRRMQATCDLPPTCPSVTCAAVFVPYLNDCATILATIPGVPLADFQSFAATCAEMQAGAGQMLQPSAVQMFRVLVNTEGAAQTGAMFPHGEEGGLPLDPLQPLPLTPPPTSIGGDETTTDVTQYHARCTAAEVVSCVPDCNVEHHGYELLATIDGTDTKFSCSLAHGLYVALPTFPSDLQ